MGQLTEGVLRNNGTSKKGGGASFPIIVDGSGTSLPTAQSEGETFLKTDNKKLYTANVGGYVLNSGVTNNGVTFNAVDGSVSDFLNSPVQNIYKGNSFAWTGSVTIKIKFKLSSSLADNTNYLLLENNRSGYGSPGQTIHTVIRIKNKKLNLLIFSTQYGSTLKQDTDICESELEINKDYYLEIKKIDNSVTITLSNEGFSVNAIETNIIETQDYNIEGQMNPSNSKQYYGYYYNGYYTYLPFPGMIYLADSTGEFVVVDMSSLFWDNGKDITDKTEYADKTNSILYLYENNELVNIGGGCSSITKQVYSISVDNTTTLDVSADFTTVIDVLKNGVELVETDDYTVSNGVITFVTALSTTDKIIVKGE